MNPQKISPNRENTIIYRSALEWRWMYKLDKNDEVVRWGSECITIPYVKPETGRVHRYYPDLMVEFRNGSKHLVEIKPEKEIKLVQEYIETGVLPKRIKTKFPNEKPSTFVYRVKAWATNVAKWKACEEFCRKKGWKFVKIGEKS